MAGAKLKTPLFVNDNFNRLGKKIRAVLVREISTGETKFTLWRQDGKPENQYPQNKDDAYYLFVEIGGYLAPLRTTYFHLVDQCGFEPACVELYGGKNQRSKHFDQFRINPHYEGREEALKIERETIYKFGEDQERQVEYVKKYIDTEVELFENSKENGGHTFPSFIGAAAKGEIDTCLELRNTYNRVLEEKEIERLELARAKRERELKQVEEETANEVQSAIQTILLGGIVKNTQIKIPNGNYGLKTTSLVNYLFRKFGIVVPLRTQGWINEKLVEVKIKDGKVDSLRFLRRYNSKCSDSFFDYMKVLVSKVFESSSETEIFETGTKSHEKS